MKLSAMIMSALLPGVDVFVKGQRVYLDVGEGFRAMAWRNGGSFGVSIGGYAIERKLTKEPRRVVEWHVGRPFDGVGLRHELSSSSMIWHEPGVRSVSTISICHAESAAPPWAPPDIDRRVGDLCFRYVNGRTQDAGYEAYEASKKPEPAAATLPS